MKNNPVKILLFIVAVLFIVSCAPTQKAAYLRTSTPIVSPNEPDNVYPALNKSFEVIDVGDDLYITVTSLSEEPNAFGENMLTSNLELVAYKVDDEGKIYLPYLKQVEVRGLTTVKLAEFLEEELREYIYQPTVIVKIINNRFSVLGDVNNPGEYVFNRQELNVLQAIALAGDISAYGNRENVMIIRQVGDNLVTKKIDVTNDEIIDTDWFFIQSNDIIYVEPLKRKALGMQTFSIFNMISLLSSTFLIYTYFDQFQTN